MKIKPCLYFLGLSCFPISLMSLINIFYSFYFDYLDNINSYVLVLFSSFIIGVFFYRIGKIDKDSINIYEQLFLVFLVYFFIPIFISVPFYLSNYNISFLDSFFESVSGFTGTGFSVFLNISVLDNPLILWRSSSQWLGGFYFLILLILVFSNKKLNYKMIDLSFNLENKTKLSSNLINVANRIFFIYIFLTIFIITIFLISGIRIFDSLNLGMTIISSGGFLPTDSLNNVIRNNFQLFSLSLSFFITVFNIYLFYNLIFKRENIKMHSEDFYLVVMIVVFSLIFYLINDLTLLSVFVNVLSSVVNSGISITSVPENFSLFFLILVLIGGSVLSTTSGIKLLRFYILIKSFLIEINKLFKPNVVVNSKIMFSDLKINNDNIKMSFLIFILFFLSQLILSTILLTDSLDFENSFKLSLLTLTNTVSSNIYGMDKILFSDLFTFTKISIIIFMVIAKAELLSILILFRKVFFKN